MWGWLRFGRAVVVSEVDEAMDRNGIVVFSSLASLFLSFLMHILPDFGLGVPALIGDLSATFRDLTDNGLVIVQFNGLEGMETILLFRRRVSEFDWAMATLLWGVTVGAGEIDIAEVTVPAEEV